jgi:transposase
MINYKPVDLPERTVTVRTKSGTYVYLTQGVEYSSKLKCSRPKRIAIGKLNEKGMLIPNQNYFDLYGKPVELDVPGERADTVSCGPFVVVDAIARKTQLMDVLESVFSEQWEKILDLATYMMMTENNVMQYFEDYGYHHALFNESNFTDSTIGRLFDNMNIKDMDLFIRAWAKMHADKDIYISYDSTNMNCVAGNLELAEYGHAKDNPDLPQVNMSLGYNQTGNKPLFYSLYPGSIIDNTECEKMVERAKYYECENMGFILDRGYFSIKNIRYFEKNGYDYILMTKGNARFVQEAVEECQAILRNGYTNYIEEHELYGMTLEKDLFGTGKTEYAHVYYDGIQAEKDKIIINGRYKKMDEIMEGKVQRKTQRKEDVKAYEGYYKVKFDDNGYLFAYQRKEKKIKEMVNKVGYFVIVTSKKMDAAEALSIYRDRDAVEKTFRMEKSYLGFDVFRVHDTEKLESKVFISFVALIIRNEIYQALKPMYKKNRKENTVPKVIREYERLGITKLSDNKYHVRYSLTSRQKKILGAVGVTEKDYMDKVNKIIQTLNEL